MGPLRRNRVVEVSPEQLLAEYESGKTTGALARIYNVSRQRIHQLLQKNGEAYKKAFDKQEKLNRNYDAFLEIVKKVGYIPALNEMRKYGSCVCYHYHEFAAKAAKQGYQNYKELRRLARIEAKRKEMVAYLIDLAKRLGRVPYLCDVEEDGQYRTADFYLFFGKY